MRKIASLLALAVGVLVSIGAQAQADVALWRIDCGTADQPTVVNERFSDSFAFPGLKLTFTFSCYLIKHGDDYMVWDTGLTPGSDPRAPKSSLADRLAEVKVKPEQVKFVGISHYHADHTGQLGPLTAATLLIGKG